MSTLLDFYDMAKDMLFDPDICSNATIKFSSESPVGGSLGGTDSTDTEVAVTCFYYKPKNNMISGTVIESGQKAVLVQLSVPETSLLLASWIDHSGEEWLVTTFEKVELNDKPILYKLLLRQ